MSQFDSSRFFYYVMYAAARTGAFRANADVSTIGHLTGEKLRRHRFAFPPLAEQYSILGFLDSGIDAMESALQRVKKSVSTLEEYRTALISAAVTGKIDVRDHASEATEAELDHISGEST